MQGQQNGPDSMNVESGPFHSSHNLGYPQGVIHPQVWNQHWVKSTGPKSVDKEDPLYWQNWHSERATLGESSRHAAHPCSTAFAEVLSR